MKKLLFALTFILMVVAGYLFARDMSALDPAGLAYVKSLLQFGGLAVVGILFICFMFINDDKDKGFVAFLGLLAIIAWRLT